MNEYIKGAETPRRRQQIYSRRQSEGDRDRQIFYFNLFVCLCLCSSHLCLFFKLFLSFSRGNELLLKGDTRMKNRDRKCLSMHIYTTHPTRALNNRLQLYLLKRLFKKTLKYLSAATAAARPPVGRCCCCCCCRCCCRHARQQYES